MPEKLRDRVKFYSTFDEIDVVEKKNLPKECGGTMELKEMTGNFTHVNLYWFFFTFVFRFPKENFRSEKGFLFELQQHESQPKTLPGIGDELCCRNTQNSVEFTRFV